MFRGKGGTIASSQCSLDRGEIHKVYERFKTKNESQSSTSFSLSKRKLRFFGKVWIHSQYRWQDAFFQTKVMNSRQRRLRENGLSSTWTALFLKYLLWEINILHSPNVFFYFWRDWYLRFALKVSQKSTEATVSQSVQSTFVASQWLRVAPNLNTALFPGSLIFPFPRFSGRKD